MIDEEKYLHYALVSAIEAGLDILSIYNDPSQDFGIERKADNSPLTLADKAAHRRIVSRLEPLGIPVLSEEGRHLPYEERALWETLWIVDPLDGTKEFIKKNGEFTVNIALVRQGQPVLGVIYVPVQEQLYFASPQTGALLVHQKAYEPLPPLSDLIARAQKLPIGQERPDEFVIVASRSHMNMETEAYIEEMQRIHPHVRLVSSGSSLKICMVAEGRADVYPRFAPTMEWDTAAGDAIARIAGCLVTNAQTGQPMQYNKADLLNPWFLVETQT